MDSTRKCRALAARALVLWRAWALRRMTHRGVLATAVTSRGRLLQSTLLRGWRAFVQRQLAVTALRRMARVHHATRLCRRLLERWAAFTAFGLKVGAILGRVHARTLQAVVAGWQHFAQRRQAVRRFMRTLKFTAMAGTFAAWLGVLLDTRAWHESLVGRVQARQRLHLLRAVFVGWKDAASLRSSLSVRLEMVSSRQRKALARDTIASWRVALHNERQVYRGRARGLRYLVQRVFRALRDHQNAVALKAYYEQNARDFRFRQAASRCLRVLRTYATQSVRDKHLEKVVHAQVRRRTASRSLQLWRARLRDVHTWQRACVVGDLAVKRRAFLRCRRAVTVERQRVQRFLTEGLQADSMVSTTTAARVSSILAGVLLSHSEDPEPGRMATLDRLDAKRVLVLWRMAAEESILKAQWNDAAVVMWMNSLLRRCLRAWRLHVIDASAARTECALADDHWRAILFAQILRAWRLEVVVGDMQRCVVVRRALLTWADRVRYKQMRRQQHLLATRSYIVRKLTWAIDVWAEGVASTKEDDMQFVAIVLSRRAHRTLIRWSELASKQREARLGNAFGIWKLAYREKALPKRWRQSVAAMEDVVVGHGFGGGDGGEDYM